jgi:hypothetical protein
VLSIEGHVLGEVRRLGLAIGDAVKGEEGAKGNTVLSLPSTFRRHGFIDYVAMRHDQEHMRFD